MGKYTYVFNGSGWFLKIDSIQILEEYINSETEKRIGILEEDQKRIENKCHSASYLAEAIRVLSSFRHADNGGFHNNAVLIKMMNDMRSTITSAIISGKTAYVNPVGGYCFSIGKTINSCTKDDFTFPTCTKSQINIKQWPNGVHFYAYVNGVEVRNGSVHKWNTYNEAQAEAEKYITKHRYSI